MVKPLKVKTVFDGFSGTSRVSQAFKNNGYTVYANDIAVWSRIFSNCYLLCRKPRAYYLPLVNYLNNLEGKKGWFSENYGGKQKNGYVCSDDGKKKIWQIKNTSKLDAIREEIDKIAVDEIDKSVLLTSLILAMDKVDSSIGHQVSYLKRWSKRSYKKMKMEVPNYLIDNKKHKVFCDDIFNLLGKLKADLVYYDPPYGSSNTRMPPSRVRYASYYHIWKTVVLNDRPEVAGAANRRMDSSDKLAKSVFEEYRKDSAGNYLVFKDFEKLIKNTRSKYILLSYNNNGRLSLKDFLKIVKKFKFRYKIKQIEYRKNVMSKMTWTNKWIDQSKSARKKVNKEYLILISK